MELMHDLFTFMRRVEPALDLDFFDIDINPDNQTGHFSRTRLPEMIEFCEHNKGYHIISFYGEAYFNKPIEQGTVFMLGLGDANQDLVCAPKLTEESYQSLQISKLWRDK